LFRGAVAQTGEAIALAVNTGRATVFGAAASALAQAQLPSPFQRDLREFGLVIARLTLALVVIVLATRVLLGRPVLDSLLFAVALAVGLTPELLPMITTVTLSRGAMRMAGRKVIAKRLASIHDLGEPWWPASLREHPELAYQTRPRGSHRIHGQDECAYSEAYRMLSCLYLFA
jgi:P-type Mg2+ transporter